MMTDTARIEILEQEIERMQTVIDFLQVTFAQEPKRKNRFRRVIRHAEGKIDGIRFALETIRSTAPAIDGPGSA
ncbi:MULTISPECIES: hypothetical protein [unclassified Microbacterium]|uniref:hypothetical protein n=1 Tax=unclassified Microbacterium TaxID=2609290 RepID=UPI00365A7208